MDPLVSDITRKNMYEKKKHHKHRPRLEIQDCPDCV